MCVRIPSRAAARASMRPSWPPPRMPMTLPCRRGALLLVIIAREEGYRGGLIAAEKLECCLDLGGAEGQDGRRPQCRVGGPGLADGKGPDRDAGRHLHDR